MYLPEYIYEQLDIVASARRSLAQDVRWDIQASKRYQSYNMNDMDVFVRKSANYRIWVDENGVGRIRILKRINFKTFVGIFEELHGEIKKKLAGNPGKVHIVGIIVSKNCLEQMIKSGEGHYSLSKEPSIPEPS